jgi:signal transduction histidine kinase
MGRPSAPPAAVELIERIGWLIRLRWLAVAGVAVVAEAAQRLLLPRLELARLYQVLGLLVALNLVYSYLFRRWPHAGGSRWDRTSGPIRRFLVPREEWGLGREGETFRAAVFANAQIVLDLVLLATLIHFAGGIENPFRYFFVFHVIIASILLSRGATYLYASVGLSLGAGLAIGEAAGWLQHHPLRLTWTETAYREPTVVGAQVFVLGTTLYIAAYMGSTIAGQLRQRERVAFELERSKSLYMRKVAHELRGPLGTIQSSLKVVLGGAHTLAESLLDLLRRAERRSGELAQLVQDLLYLARAREASLSAALGPMDPAAAVADLVREAEPSARQSGVALLLDVGPATGRVECDAAAFRQLVDNLLSNALRYTPRGGQVRVKLDRVAGRLRLVVEDTGIGIPAADLSRVFDEFFRAANARERIADGTGLGLSIVRALAEQYGGSVAAESEEGRGTRFTIVLPLPPLS